MTGWIASRKPLANRWTGAWCVSPHSSGSKCAEAIRMLRMHWWHISQRMMSFRYSISSERYIVQRSEFVVFCTCTYFVPSSCQNCELQGHNRRWDMTHRKQQTPTIVHCILHSCTRLPFEESFWQRCALPPQALDNLKIVWSTQFVSTRTLRRVANGKRQTSRLSIAFVFALAISLRLHMLLKCESNQFFA